MCCKYLGSWRYWRWFCNYLNINLQNYTSLNLGCEKVYCCLIILFILSLQMISLTHSFLWADIPCMIWSRRVWWRQCRQQPGFPTAHGLTTVRKKTMTSSLTFIRCWLALWLGRVIAGWGRDGGHMSPLKPAESALTDLDPQSQRAICRPGGRALLPACFANTKGQWH